MANGSDNRLRLIDVMVLLTLKMYVCLPGIIKERLRNKNSIDFCSVRIFFTSNSIEK